MFEDDEIVSADPAYWIPSNYRDEPVHMAITADGSPVVPPASWFNDPALTRPTALVIEQDGRVYGHIACWETKHIGMPGAIRPPRSKSNYAFFATGAVHTQEGHMVDVGQITLVGGHAPIDVDVPKAVAHYDDTQSAVCDVAIGEDRHGIWVAGALRPDVDDKQVRQLRASAVSGDWRPINGNLELVAVCSVNVPGFPIPRARVASGQTLALVAAGIELLVEDRLREYGDGSQHEIDEVLMAIATRVERLEAWMLAVVDPENMSSLEDDDEYGHGEYDDDHEHGEGCGCGMMSGGYEMKKKRGAMVSSKDIKMNADSIEKSTSIEDLRKRVHSPLMASLRSRVHGGNESVPFDRAAELRNRVHASTGVTAAVGKFDTSLHPRGKDGKFIEKLGFVNFSVGRKQERGQVVGIGKGTGNNKGKTVLTIQKEDGSTVDVTSDKVSQAAKSKADLAAPKSKQSKTDKLASKAEPLMQEGQSFMDKPLEDWTEEDRYDAWTTAKSLDDLSVELSSVEDDSFDENLMESVSNRARDLYDKSNKYDQDKGKTPWYKETDTPEDGMPTGTPKLENDNTITLNGKKIGRIEIKKRPNDPLADSAFVFDENDQPIKPNIGLLREGPATEKPMAERLAPVLESVMLAHQVKSPGAPKLDGKGDVTFNGEKIGTIKLNKKNGLYDAKVGSKVIGNGLTPEDAMTHHVKQVLRPKNNPEFQKKIADARAKESEKDGFSKQDQIDEIWYRETGGDTYGRTLSPEDQDRLIELLEEKQAETGLGGSSDSTDLVQLKKWQSERGGKSTETPAVKAARDKAKAESIGGGSKLAVFPGEASWGTEGKFSAWTINEDGSKNGGRGDFDTMEEAQAFVDQTNKLTDLRNGTDPYYDETPIEEQRAKFEELKAKWGDESHMWDTAADFAPEDREDALKYRFWTFNKTFKDDDNSAPDTSSEDQVIEDILSSYLDDIASGDESEFLQNVEDVYSEEDVVALIQDALDWSRGDMSQEDADQLAADIREFRIRIGGADSPGTIADELRQVENTIVKRKNNSAPDVPTPAGDGMRNTPGEARAFAAEQDKKQFSKQDEINAIFSKEKTDSFGRDLSPEDQDRLIELLEEKQAETGLAGLSDKEDLRRLKKWQSERGNTEEVDLEVNLDDPTLPPSTVSTIKALQKSADNMVSMADDFRRMGNPTLADETLASRDTTLKTAKWLSIVNSKEGSDRLARIAELESKFGNAYATDVVKNMTTPEERKELLDLVTEQNKIDATYNPLEAREARLAAIKEIVKQLDSGDGMTSSAGENDETKSPYVGYLRQRVHQN